MGQVLGTGVKVMVAVGVVAGLGLGVWFGSQSMLRKSSERELGQAWVAFAKCTVGEAPLAGETPSVRFRAIQLGASASDWPTRCGVFQGNLFNASHRAARFGVRNFEDDVPRADLTTDMQAFSITPEQLDKLFKDAATLPAASAPFDLHTVVDAPPPADLVRLSKLKPLAQGPVLATDPVTYGDVRLLFADRVCWMRAADHLATATCTPIVAAADGFEHVLASSEDGAPPVVLPRGDTGIVHADGTAFILGQGDPYTIIKKTTDGKVTRMPFGRPAGENIAAIQLVGDALVWTIGTTTDPWGDYYGGGGYAPYGGYYSVNMFARTLSATGQLGATSDIGPPWGTDVGGALVGCHTSEALFFKMNEALLPHTKKEGWGAFVAAPRGIPPIAESMVCSGTETQILGLTDASLGAPSVQQTHCTNTSCSVATVSIDAPGAYVNTVRDLSAVTALGEPIVVVRESNGLRVRVARLTDLPSTPDRVLLDGDDNQPGSESVRHVSLYGRSGSGGPMAVLVVSADKGTFAFTVEVSGKVTPIDIK